MIADIIIPQFNCADYTVGLLKSIETHTRNYRIILIDNNSKPEELEKTCAVLDRLPHTLITNTENLGFIKAVNQGMALSTAPFVVLQNNDTLVEKDWLTKLLKVFKRYPNAGLVGPTTIYSESWQNRNIIKENRKRIPTGIGEVGGMLAFFCVVIKREVIEQVGYLSEEYGLGFADDDDYCERAKAAGFKLYCNYDVTVPHYGRTTFKAFIPNWEESKERNLAFFREKWKRNPPGPGPTLC